MSKPTRPAGPNNKDTTRINEQIRVAKIRLIDENGEMVGVVSPAEGMEMAREAGLDLVEVSPNAEPPVCKILDYGKYKYHLQKKLAEAKKKQKIVSLKEIKLRPSIEDNDYNVKMRSILKFLAEGDKVKITMRFKGREMVHQDLGLKLLHKVKDELAEIAKVEHEPKMEGRQIIMILAPIKLAV